MFLALIAFCLFPPYEWGPWNQPLQLSVSCIIFIRRNIANIYFLCKRHVFMVESIYFWNNLIYLNEEHIFVVRVSGWGCVILARQMNQTLRRKLHLAGRRCSGRNHVSALLCLGWGWELEDWWLLDLSRRWTTLFRGTRKEWVMPSLCIYIKKRIWGCDLHPAFV